VGVFIRSGKEVMEASPGAQTPTTLPPELQDSILKILEGEPHRTYTSEDLVKLLKPQAAKDPQKQSQALEEVASELKKLIEEGRISEVTSGTFKARIFFDHERNIEHAFMGGMGNTSYRFRSPIFRMNIGVLSLYFVRDDRKGHWMVTVRDTTIGKDYGLVQRLTDGVYVFGTRPPEAGEAHFLQIEGRYMAKEHATLTLSGDEVTVEDHKTLNGTRIDFLTQDGLAHYQQMAKAFLQGTDPKSQRDPVKRGRFVLDELLQHHKNYETTFFGFVADSLLLDSWEKSQKN
jgi:uncharacterized protein (DUF2267 family)